MNGKKVNILLSVYNPNVTYLVEQLKSIDKQKYRILPYKKKNIGYVKAFEYLVEQADGNYIAFCDQDDIWDKTKIEKCIQCMEKEHTILVVTDRKIIDAEGEATCNSVRHTSKKV